MSRELHVGHVMATPRNAMISQEIVYADLRRLGMGHDEATVYADPTNEKKLDSQYERLKSASLDSSKSGSYLGVYNSQSNDELIALMKLGPWSHGDQMQYETGVSRVIERGLARGALNLVGQSRKYGIHHLSAHDRITETEQQESVQLLATKAIECCNTSARDIYIPMTEDDVAMKQMLELGFVDTEKTGSPIGAIQQRLFVRRYDTK